MLNVTNLSLLEIRDQAILAREIVKFNKEMNFLKKKPTKKKIREIKLICLKIRGFDFDFNKSDVEFMKQIEEFSLQFKKI